VPQTKLNKQLHRNKVILYEYIYIYIYFYVCTVIRYVASPNNHVVVGQRALTKLCCAPPACQVKFDRAKATTN